MLELISWEPYSTLFCERHTLHRILQMDAPATSKTRLQKLLHYTTLWFWQDGFLWDWLLVIIIVRVNRALLKPMTPIHRYYEKHDPTLSYPLQPCRPGHAIFWNSVLYGPALVGIICQLGRRSWAVAWPDWHHLQLSVGEAYALACTMKHILEHTGQLRPNWIARLESKDQELIDDGRSGYPSGHALYSMMAATLLALYFMGRMKVLARSTRGHFAKLVVAMLPVFGAIMVGLERYVCYDHDTAATLAGGIIGATTGTISYLLNFGSLMEYETSGVPKIRLRWEESMSGHEAEEPLLDEHRRVTSRI